MKVIIFQLVVQFMFQYISEQSIIHLNEIKAMLLFRVKEEIIYQFVDLEMIILLGIIIL